MVGTSAGSDLFCFVKSHIWETAWGRWGPRKGQLQWYRWENIVHNGVCSKPLIQEPLCDVQSHPRLIGKVEQVASQDQV